MVPNPSEKSSGPAHLKARQQASPLGNQPIYGNLLEMGTWVHDTLLVLGGGSPASETRAPI
jgi:hypothetical protein